MSTIIGIKELRQDMEHYAREVKRGRSFIVVKHSRPVFSIVSVLQTLEDEKQWQTVLNFHEIRKGGVSFDDLGTALKELKSRHG